VIDLWLCKVGLKQTTWYNINKHEMNVVIAMAVSIMKILRASR
jgi:hypothetical protein